MIKATTEIPDWAKGQIESAGPIVGAMNSQAPGPLQAVPITPQLLNQAKDQLFFTGGSDAYMAMFPNDYAEDVKDVPNVFERGARGIAAGIAELIPSSLTVAGGLVDFLGADELGQGMAETGIGMSEWLQQHVAVENPTFYDQLMTGVGSMASFLVPGLGAAGLASKGAQALQLSGKAAKAFKIITGAGSMAFLESSIEQSQRERELMSQGMTAGEAFEASQDVFWQNMLLLTASNAVFFTPGRRVAKLAMGAITEGGQERAQGVIQDVAAGQGKWVDFFDPKKYGTETAIGAIIGGGAAYIVNEQPSKDTGKKKDEPKEQKKPSIVPANPEIPSFEAPEVGEIQPPEVQGKPVYTPPDLSVDEQSEAVMALVEAGLSDAYGTEFNLSDRLTEEQYNQVAELATQAVLEEDNQAAWRLEDQAWRMAEDFLFRGDQNVKIIEGEIDEQYDINQRRIKQDERNEEAELDDERFDRAGEYVRDVDDGIGSGVQREKLSTDDRRAQRQIGKAEQRAGVPDLSGFATTSRERADANEQDIIDTLPDGLLPIGRNFSGARNASEQERLDIRNETKSQRRKRMKAAFSGAGISQISAGAISKKQPTAAQEVTEPEKAEIFPAVDSVQKEQVKTEPKAEPKLPKPVPVKGHLLPLVGIHTDEKTFQMRDELDQDFVDEKVKAFDRFEVEPITVWKDPKTNRWIVLDGHHTMEILKGAGQKTAEVKIFKGTKEQAIAKSETINARKQGVKHLDAVKVLRKMVDAGATKKAIAEKAVAYGRNRNTYIALANLNPKGQIISSLRALQKSGDAELNAFMDIARWVGMARGAVPDLTDANEQEMFDFLRKKKGDPGHKTQAEFAKRVSGITDQMFFDPSKSLNLANATSKSPESTIVDMETGAAKAELAEAKSIRDEKQSEFLGSDMTEAQIADAMKKYHDAVLIAERELLEITQRGKDLKSAGSDQGAMFLYVDENGNEVEVLSKVQVEDINDRTIESFMAQGGNLITGWGAPNTKIAKIITDAGKALGVDIKFFELNGGQSHGLQGFYPVLKGNKKQPNTVYINRDAVLPLMTIAGHEIGHWMEKHHPEQWVDIANVAIETVRPGGATAYSATLPKSYGGPVAWAREMVSDMVAEAWTHESFWEELARRNPGAFRNLSNKVREVLGKIREYYLKHIGGRGMEAYIEDLGRLERTVAKAMSDIADINTKEMAGREQAETGQTNIFVDSQEIEGIEPLVADDEAPKFIRDNIETRRRTETGLANLRVRTWRDWPRLVYSKMWDDKTWVYRAIKDTLGKRYRDYNPLKNPYDWVRKFAAWTDLANLHLRHGVYQFGTEGGDPIKLSEGLEQIFEKFGLAKWIDNGVFGEFMIAARLESGWNNAFDKAVADIKKGSEGFLPDDINERATEAAEEAYFEDEAAKAEYDQYMEAYAQMKVDHPKWFAAAKEMTNWSNAIMSRVMDSGAMSEEMYNDLISKYDVYAPLFILERETTQKGKPVFEMGKFKAGQTRADPIDSMVKNAYRVEHYVQKNKAKMVMGEFISDLGGDTKSLKNVGRRVTGVQRPLQEYVNMIAGQMGIDLSNTSPEVKETLEKLAKMFMANETSEELEKYVPREFDNGKLISFMKNGVPHYYEVMPDIADTYDNLGRHTTHALMKFYTAQTNLLRAGAILTPDFMARNQFRDFLGAGIIAEHLVANPKDALYLFPRIIGGLRSSMKSVKGEIDDDMRNFMLSKAGQATLVSLDQETLRNTTQDLLGGKHKLNKMKGHPVKFLLHSHPIKVLQMISSVFENSTRLAVHKATADRLISKGMDPKEAHARASMEARESSTDFNRAGTYGHILNKMIPFFNASMQGIDKLWRSGVRDEGRRGATWARGVLMLTVPSMMLWMANHDEEWYKDLPPWMKNHFWLFSVDGGRTIHKIPKPFDVGLLFASLPERFAEWMLKEDPDAVKDWADGWQKDIFQPDLNSLLGPIAGAISENRSNYDNYRDTPIVKGYLQKVEARYQFSASTSEFAKVIGDAFPGEGMSPLKIDHFIRSSFGGLGGYASEIASNIIMEVDPGRRAGKASSRLVYDSIPDWMPVIKSFTMTTPAAYGQHQSDFYRQMEKSRTAHNTLSAFKRGGASPEEFLALYKRRAVDLALYETFQRGSQALGRLSKAIRAVEVIPASEMSRKEKRKRIDELLEQRGKFMMRFMERMDKIDRDMIQKKADEAIPRLRKQFKGRE